MALSLWLLSLLMPFLVSSQSPSNCNINCSTAQLNWTIDNFGCCIGDIRIQGGVLNLAGWNQSQINEVFQKKNKALVSTGINLIGNDKITRLDIRIFPDANNFTIKNNPKLIRVELTLEDAKKPMLFISGNRVLKEDALAELQLIKADGSYVQSFKECDFNGSSLASLADLTNCFSIYGDLIIDKSTKIASNLSDHRLEKLKGCLTVKEANFSTMDELRFLENIAPIAGECASNHKIEGNKKLCIHPAEEEKLKNQFAKLSIKENASCKKQCTSEYLMRKRMPGCHIITDDLMIEGSMDLGFLESIEEIKGTLSIVATNISIFNFLKNLKSLNMDKSTSGALVEARFNPQLMNIILPSGLQHAKGFPTQMPIYLEGNPKFTDTLSLKKALNYSDEDEINDNAEQTGSSIGEEDENAGSLRGYIVYGIISGCILLISCGALVVALITNFKLSAPFWLIRPASNVGAKDITRYEKSDSAGDEFYNLAAKRIKQNESTIRKAIVNSRKKRTFWNSIASAACAPSEFEADDYKENKKQRRIAANCPDSTEHLPLIADDGRFGFGHIQRAGNPVTIMFAHQCDQFSAVWLKAGIQPILIEGFKTTAWRMTRPAAQRIAEKLRYLRQWTAEGERGIKEFKVNFKNFKPGVFESNVGRKLSNKMHPLMEEAGIAYHFPVIVPWRYIGIELQPEKKLIRKYPIYSFSKAKAGRSFIERMVQQLLCLPPGYCLNLAEDDIDYFFSIIQPKYFKAQPVKKAADLKTEDSELPPYVKYLNGVHTRIVGELRGDFDALRQIFSIPANIAADDSRKTNNFSQNSTNDETNRQTAFSSNASSNTSRHEAGLDGLSSAGDNTELTEKSSNEQHRMRKNLIVVTGSASDLPFIKYNWIFLGNYASGHPQSLETLLLLLSMEYLVGPEHICLLRGSFEYSDMFAKSGFAEQLSQRFGPDVGSRMAENFAKIFAQMPLNCVLLNRICCTHGGFTESDIAMDYPLKYKKAAREQGPLDSPHKIKAWSLPNMTVKHYVENVDTMAGYYYGERILERISSAQNISLFFSTTPLETGVGFFGEYFRSRLYTIGSVRGLVGPTGDATRIPVVAEVNAETQRLLFNVILQDNESFQWNKKTKRLKLVEA